MFRTVPLSIIRSFSLYTQQWCMSYMFADSLRAGSGRNWVSSWSCSQAVSKPVWHTPLLCGQWKTPDDGPRNCPNHVEFYSNNKFEKLVHLVGFIIRIAGNFLTSWGRVCVSWRTVLHGISLLPLGKLIYVMTACSLIRTYWWRFVIVLSSLSPLYNLCRWNIIV